MTTVDNYSLRVDALRKLIAGAESEELFRQTGVQHEFLRDEILQYDNQ